MTPVALTIAIVVYAVIVQTLLKECPFLEPLEGIIWEQYGEALVWFSLVLLLNLFIGAYTLLGKLALWNTGDKLSHLEKQLHGRTTISDELTERIHQRK